VNKSVLVARHTELADDEDVERCAEGGGNLVADGHTSPWKGQDHDVIAISVVLKEAGEDPTGISPITKNTLWHGRALPPPAPSQAAFRSEPRISGAAYGRGAG
jgi:hypothetical protein